MQRQAGALAAQGMTPLDTLLEHETPEGILLELRLAGPVVRACAWAIDAVIRGVLYIGLGILLSYLGQMGTAVMLILFFVIEWFYPVFFEVRSGMTPGKQVMGVWVIHDNGTPVSLPSSLVRNLLRTADFFPLFYGAGLLTMLMNRQFKRLGDLAAGTLVVYRDPHGQRRAMPEAQPEPPPQGLSYAGQEALLDFAERDAQLSAERKAELATLLHPVTGCGGAAAVAKLHGYANWLARGR